MKELKDHNYFGIDATIIADSKNRQGQRIVSYVVTFPRIVLAEFNTHRLFSRNSASSRAIPTNVMLDRVINNPFIPIRFQKAHKGMQGDSYFEESIELKSVENEWLEARDSAVKHAQTMHELGVTKQIINRILEPYLWHTVIVTSTEWENYFNLRDHPAAEIHIADLAHKMRIELDNSTPKMLQPGEWHIPFGDLIDENKLDEAYETLFPESGELYAGTSIDDLKTKIAIARCARVSYGSFEGADDYVKDIKLFERLSGMGHWSPFEHVARAMSHDEYNTMVKGTADEFHSHSAHSEVSFLDDFDDKDGTIDDGRGWSRNFKGFVQLRSELD